MIMHVAPRCVAIVSHLNGVPAIHQIKLDSIATLDLSDRNAGECQLIVHQISGRQSSISRYSDPAEAGADFGKMRVLMGLSAWPEEWEQFHPATGEPAPVVRRPRRPRPGRAAVGVAGGIAAAMLIGLAVTSFRLGSH